MSGRHTRVRGFAPWRPQAGTRALLDEIREVLAEYRGHWPLTIRQVFYRLVGSRGYDKTEQGYERLCEKINRARRAGMLEFEAFRDDGLTRLASKTFDDADDFRLAVADTAKRFRLDRQDGQPVRLWLICEAAGMAPMLSRIAREYGVPVLSSGGFDSLTAKRELADELVQADLCEVLHIGDHDPSGVHVFSSLAEDVSEMCVGLGGSLPRFTRLAVTLDQAAALGLPTAPAKKTDNRDFVGETVQAEAIPPDRLAEIIRNAIQERQNSGKRKELLAAERETRAELIAWAHGAV